MSSYFSNAFNPEVVKETVSLVKRLHEQGLFHAIVVTGMSGTSMGFQVKALLPEINLFVYRKPEDSSHGGSDIFLYGNGYAEEGGKYLFIDDFIDSGATFQRMSDKVGNLLQGELSAAIFYQKGGWGNYECVEHLDAWGFSGGKYSKIKQNETI